MPTNRLAAAAILLTGLGAAPAEAQSNNPYTFPVASDTQFCTTGRTGAVFQSNGVTVDHYLFADAALMCGLHAVANSTGTTAIGTDAVADATEATAIGHQSWARASRATALGSNATATQAGSTAIGSNAQATHAGSTAIGANATTTAPNQVALGGTGTSVRVGDMAASTGAQVGPVDVVTVDASGTLGRDRTLAPAIQGLVQVSLAQTARLNTVEAQQALLASSVDALFDLRQVDRRDMQQGIAAAVAMGQPHMPSAAGRTSYVLNVSTFRGEQAIGGALMHRLQTGAPLAISAGFSYAGNRNNAARVGIAGEF